MPCTAGGLSGLFVCFGRILSDKSSFCFFFSRGYIANLRAPIQSRNPFFALNASVKVVKDGQNKNPLWNFDHWTKVRLWRDYFGSRRKTNNVILRLVKELEIMEQMPADNRMISKETVRLYLGLPHSYRWQGGAFPCIPVGRAR